MDALGAFFLFIFLMIFLISNILFIKKLSSNRITRFKYKLLFSLMCIVLLMASMIFYLIFKTSVLIDLLNLEINDDSYRDRIIAVTSVSIFNTAANLLWLKFYSNKIYLKENTKTNEIELIGTE